jgi:predicted ferric reductase
MQLRYAVRGAAWVILYLFFILAPLFALLVGPLPPTRDFWTEFSVAIGYAGLAMMGLQFGLTARFRQVTEPWGEDFIYHFHRQISLIAVGLVVAHPLILFVVRPELLALLNSIEAPWRARFAALSTYSLMRWSRWPCGVRSGISSTRRGTSPISCWRWSRSRRG